MVCFKITFFKQKTNSKTNSRKSCELPTHPADAHRCKLTGLYAWIIFFPFFVTKHNQIMPFHTINYVTLGTRTSFLLCCQETML